MAGQTDSADDLIAELAKLMAEDAQTEKPKREPPAAVRIPGGDAPASAAPPVQSEAPVRPVRIPGGDPTPRATSEAPIPRPQNPAPSPQRSEPQAFEAERSAVRKSEDRPAASLAERVEPAFGMPSAGIASAPTPSAQPQQVAPSAPVAVAPQSQPATPASVEVSEVDEALPDLDGDSLADLIAAELAVSSETIVSNEASDIPAAALDVSDEIPGDALPREVDAFGVPPVFGLGSGKPQHTQPAPAPVDPLPEPPVASVAPKVEVASAAKPEADIDPLEEIERLIGPAAHIQTTAPSPALRSLATPTLPQKQPPAAAIPTQSRVQVNSVEEAILSAAATSGARVEWVEPAISASLGQDEPDVAPRAPRRSMFGMRRSVAGPLVATLMLAVAAVGLYAVLGLGGQSDDGPAPLLAADANPIKDIPEPATEPSAATQSVVFNEISGVDRGADEQIVSRDQSDVEEVAQVASSDLSQDGLVNRKVRTVTVRPDGTIVSGNDSLAGSAMLPVDRPQVPDVPGADFSTPELIANANAEATASALEPNPIANTAPVVQPGSTVPAVDLSGAAISGLMAPVPLTRPTTFAPQSAATTPTTPATTQPVASTPAAAAPVQVATAPPAQPGSSAANTAPAYVQLSSQRTEEAARQSALDIASRFGSLFNGVSLEVQRVDLGDRGIFYRVRVPADSIQSANTICSNVKANGGDCFTL